MTDKEAHLHKNNDNLSIQNQVGNSFSLNLFLWRHFPVSSDRVKLKINNRVKLKMA